MTAIEYRFAADPAKLGEIRGQMRAAMESRGVEPKPIARVLLAFDEVVNNAIEHGGSYRTADHLLHVRVSILDGDLCLDFFDLDVPEELVRQVGQLLAANSGKPPSLESERGRGLFLIDDAFDEVSINVGRDGGMHLRGRVLKVCG